MPKLDTPDLRFRLYESDTNSARIGVWAWSTPPNSVFAKLKAARDAVVDIAPSLRSARAEMESAKELTDAGIEKALLGRVPDAAAKLRKAQREVEKARADVAKRRAALTFKTPDPNNLAALLEAQEIRAWVRSLSQKDRDAYFVDPAKVNPVVANALTAPPELTTVAPSLFNQLRERALEAQHPGVIEEIAEVEEAIGVVEQTIAANNDALQREVGMHRRAEIGDLAQRAAEEVDRLAAEEEKKAPQPPAFDEGLASIISAMPWAEREKVIQVALDSETFAREIAS